METSKAIENLAQFVGEMTKAGVSSRKDFNAWKKEKKIIKLMEEVFAYKQAKGMPNVNSLVTLDFHTEIPILLLNYTPVAHNTLHLFPQGWTMPLRQCRGIVFDHQGNLVAKPFPKFFNYGQHPETMNIPVGRLEATDKKDGHLGIIFEYDAKRYITTRGRFNSPTSVLATEMLRRYEESAAWDENFDNLHTLLVEIIHPETAVYTDYRDFQAFIVIGAYNLETYEDMDFFPLSDYAAQLELPMVFTYHWDLEKIKEQMDNVAIKNKEGVVVRCSNGLRVKFKYKNYIGKMVADKLSYKYLMQRIMAGNLEQMLQTLPEEIHSFAILMLGQIFYSLLKHKTPQDKWTELYGLVPEEERTSYFKQVCRNFVKTL